MLVISIPFYVEKNYFFSRVRKVGIWGSCTYILPVFRAFLHFFDVGRMSVDVGQKQTFPKNLKIFCVFPFLHCRLFVVTVGDGHFHTFYIEKIFTFFLAYVKYTYECHRLSLPSFSGFFALFLWQSVTVALSALTQGVDGKDACKRLAVCYHNLHLAAHRPLDGAARGVYLLLQLVLLVLVVWNKQCLFCLFLR